MSNVASPGSAIAGPMNTTPRRLNTANAATQNPQAGTRFISSCNRCRRRKIKCDAGIPSCNACSDSKTTCEYHDVVANTDLPRARIIGLEQHLQHLLNLQAQVARQPALNSGNITVDGVVQPEFRGRLVVSGIRLACAFCRKRKIKCDGTAPCAGCSKFGKPKECSILYEEASSQGRSYMSYLEDKIVKLDRQLSMPSVMPSGPATTSHIPNAYPHTSSQANQPDSFASRIDPSITQASLPPEEVAKSLQGDLSDKVQGVLRELENLTDDSPAVITNQSMHTPWNFRVSLLSLAGYRDDTGPFMTTLSRTIVHPLVQHYVTDIHPTIPFLSIADLNRAVEKFHNQEASANEKFKVLMVVSIATAAISDHPTSMANWNALKFFSTASYCAAYDPDTLEGLELNLLVLQFATLNPSKLNAWYLAGIGMRACASLGLHGRHNDMKEQVKQPDNKIRNCTPDTNMNQELVAWKNRLFWASYSYDRVLSMTAGRPHGFDDSAITVSLPDQMSHDVYGDWPELLLQRLRLIRMQSVMYTKLFQCDPNAVPSRDESLATIRQMELDLQEWSVRTKSLNPKAYSMFAIEFAGTELLMYRPCAALPRRDAQDLLRMADAAVRSIQGAFSVIYGRPKKFYTYFMIARVYTAALALIYTFAQPQIVQDSSNEALKSQLAPVLNRACACLFHLSQEYLVGQDLAQRFVQISSRFFEWLHAGATGEIGLLEIRDFHMHHLGPLERTERDESGSWTKLMHRLLPESTIAASVLEGESTSRGNVIGRNDGVESMSADGPSSTSTAQYSSGYHGTTMANNPDPYHAQVAHNDGLAQPAPYSQMSQFGMQGQQQLQAYNTSARFAPNASSGEQAYGQHLPHRPSLQAHESASLTPLQQLAATAASHPTHGAHDSAIISGDGFRG